MSREKVSIPEKELRRLYLEGKLPMSKIAEKFNCSASTISLQMKKYGIKARGTSQAMKLAVNPREYRIEVPKDELINISKGEAKPSEVAEKYNCAISTVQRRAREHGIELNMSKGKELNISKEELKQLYVHEKLGTQEIAERYQCSKGTVLKKLHEYGIEVRQGGPPKVEISKERLQELYVDKELSIWEIEEKYGYPRSTVHRKLLEYGIETRDVAEANIKYPRKDFDGDEKEKAYLIGFAIGDLRARQIGVNSKTVKVDCGSTREEQVNLFHELFSEYGRVWQSEPYEDGKVQMEAFLDESFSFLLDSRERLGEAVEEELPPFLAGLVDADGSFFVTQEKACFSIGTYDRELLKTIKGELQKRGIFTTSIATHQKLYETTGGYTRNDFYKQLQVYRKDSLLKLINLLEPHVKHQGRKQQIQEALTNIQRRNRS